MAFPDLNTVPAFYHNYIKLIREDQLQPAIENHLQPLISMLGNCSEDQWGHAYAPGKWTLKELVQHIIDGERIFSHRALSIARLDPNPLPGFDENEYAAQSMANARTGAALLRELHALSESTACLFGSFTEEQLNATGMANNASISVNAIGYIVCGHALHHTGIVRERYLVGG